MTEPLWQFDALVLAAGGAADGAPSRAITGFSIDTRQLAPGEVFVALKDARDGHDFVTTAFANGASAALVAEGYRRQDGDGALIRVADTLKALEGVGRSARERLGPEARVVAVTGSVGKTTTKEMMRACLTRLGPTHAADRSFNNHWGVPLTLARMPRQTRFGVFEIGMNHPGEIAPLSDLVRPHVAIITTVEPVHLEHFASVEDIARAKAEIFSGLEPGGTAVLNMDNAYFPILREAAEARGAIVKSFSGRGASGATLAADLAALRFEDGKTVVEAGPWRYRMAIPGDHMVMNSLAVAAALDALGVDVAVALDALSTMRPPEGRGTRTEIFLGEGTLLLIDESYNANPASMRAALAVLGRLPRSDWPRRVAVLGDMLELGADSPALHAALCEGIDAASADLVFAAGPEMAHLYERLPPARQGGWAPTSRDLEAQLLAALRPGDAVMIKGSNGSRMGRLVEAVRSLDRGLSGAGARGGALGRDLPAGH